MGQLDKNPIYHWRRGRLGARRYPSWDYCYQLGPQPERPTCSDTPDRQLVDNTGLFVSGWCCRV